MANERKRQDVHRPSIMDPADYVWIGEADDHANDGYVDFDWERYAELTGQPELANRDYRDPYGAKWANVQHAESYRLESGERIANGWRTGGCDHCGQTRIRYWMFYLHLPTREVVSVGTRCASKLSLDSKADIARRAQIERERKASALAKWIAADELNEKAWADLMGRQDEAGGSGGAGNEFVDSLVNYANRNGCLTDGQRDAVLKGIETRATRAAERAEQNAGDPEPSAVIAGRITIEGRLLTVKNQEGRYGCTTKMLVLDDRGFKVWGTFPDSFSGPLFDRAIEDGSTDIRSWLSAGAKARVRFAAAVEQSRDDETFGFFKRPTKAEVIA